MHFPWEPAEPCIVVKSSRERAASQYRSRPVCRELETLALLQSED